MFNYYYAGLFVVFAIVAYMIAVDANVAAFITLYVKLLRVNVSRAIFYLKVYPRLRWDTFMLKRRMGKPSRSHYDMAEQIAKEINEKR